jgi:transcriptional regulator with XRE-family HTH domain
MTETDPEAFALLVGERIRTARQERGWTQVELADAAGLSSNYVARLERGELGPSLFVACKLADAFGSNVDSLVGAQEPATGRRRRSTSGTRSAG